jgi:GTP:adenosylcobinamide-phosphate guanylyltransferase
VKVDAVVLAGGDGAVIDSACRFKGLLPISGRPMVEWVVDALRAAEYVGAISVVVPTAEDLGPWVDKVDKLVVSDQEFMDNVLAGVASFRDDLPVLVATGDLPVLTGAAVDDFVGEALRRGADFSYPLVPKEDMVAAFPAGKRTYFKLRSGSYTGGNVALIAPAAAERNREIGQRMFELRKSALSLVQLLGFRFALKFVLGLLEPPEVERKMRDLVGCSGAAVICRHASIGMDVDKPADVALVEEMLRRGPAAMSAAV